MKVWTVVLAFCTVAGTDVRKNGPLLAEGPDEVHKLFSKLLAHARLADHELEYLARITSFVDKKARAKQCTGFGCPIDFDCINCRLMFNTVFTLVLLGWRDDDLIKAAQRLCVTFTSYTDSVCNGIISLNAPILAYIIRNTPEARPATFCSLFLQDGNDPHRCPSYDRRFEWTIKLPEYQGFKKPTTTNTKPLKIALINDAHIDPMYEPGGVADCDEPVCCRKGQKPRPTSRKPQFTYGTTRPINWPSGQYGQKPSVSQPAGYWGDYRNCDMPTWTFDNVIEEINDKHDIDIIYYIGDTIDHHIWETSYEYVKKSHSRVVDKIRRTFGDQVLAFLAVGNHESQPTNQFAPSSVTEPILNTTWLYNSLADKWGDYLDVEASKTLRKTGSYSMLVRPGFRVISLNSNVAYRLNWWIVFDPLECKRQLQWLVSQLQEAERAGEAVHILGHIPPGMEDLTYTWTREYNRVVNRFQSTIAAEFNGHTHEDGFKLFFDPRAPTFATNVAWNGGGITTFNDYNLNYKILNVDPRDYKLTEMMSYSFNLTEANLTPKIKPLWFKLYDWRCDFGLADLSAASMVYLVYRMATTERHLLDKYASFTSKLSDVRWPNCDETCKLDVLCETVVTVLWEREKCTELRNLFYNRACK